MDIEYDEAKNQSNVAKHHLDFEEAAKVFLDQDRFDFPDDRKNYGEERRLCLGAIPPSGHIFVVVYTLRGTNIRLISARKANEREQRTYHHHRLACSSE